MYDGGRSAVVEQSTLDLKTKGSNPATDTCASGRWSMFVRARNTNANPKSCLGRVFNFKFEFFLYIVWHTPTLKVQNSAQVLLRKIFRLSLPVYNPNER